MSKSRRPHAPSRQELITALRGFAADTDTPVTKTAIDNADTLPPASTFQDRFGSWRDALDAAGVEPPSHARFSTADLIASLRAFAIVLDRTPTQRHIQVADELPSLQTYKRRFGSWNTALEAAGLDTNTPDTYDLSDAELLARLREFAADTDTIPAGHQVDAADEMPSADTYYRRFGSWTDALLAADLLDPA